MMRLFIRTDLHKKIVPYNEDLTEYKELPTNHLNLKGQGTCEQTGFLSVFEMVPQNNECLVKKLQSYAGYSKEQCEADSRKYQNAINLRFNGAIKYTLDYYSYLGISQAKYFHIICLDTDDAHVEEIFLSGKVKKEGDDSLVYAPNGTEVLPPFKKDKAQIFNTIGVEPLFAPGEFKEIAEILLGGGWHKFASVLTLDVKQLSEFLLDNRREFTQSSTPDGQKIWYMLKQSYSPYPLESTSSAKILRTLKRRHESVEENASKVIKTMDLEKISALEGGIINAHGVISEEQWLSLNAQLISLKEDINTSEQIDNITKKLHDSLYDNLGTKFSSLEELMASLPKSEPIDQSFTKDFDAIAKDIEVFKKDHYFANKDLTFEIIGSKIRKLAERGETMKRDNNQELPSIDSYKPN